MIRYVPDKLTAVNAMPFIFPQKKIYLGFTFLSHSIAVFFREKFFGISLVGSPYSNSVGTSRVWRTYSHQRLELGSNKQQSVGNNYF